MANNQDARPFVDLQKDAEEFVTKFEDDIEKCKKFLDLKITSLICDPDSLGNSAGPKQNALVEFSKAKYDIFISVKSLLNDMEREWLKYIAVMKKLFLENVEIFLAGTKLEIKLPSSEYQSLSGTKKSPGYKKSSTVTSSLYPIISNITKNIPVLGSSLRNKEFLSTEEHQETSNMFSQMDKFADFEVENEEAEMEFNTPRSSSRSRKSTKVDNCVLNSSLTAAREKSRISERRDLSNSPDLISTSFVDNLKSHKSSSPNLKRNSLRASHSSDTSEEEVIESKQDISQPYSQGRGRGSRFETRKSLNSKAMNSSHLKGHSQQGKQPVQNNKELHQSNKSESDDSENTSEDNQAISKQSENNSSDESEEIKEESSSVAPLKGRKGRQTAKNKPNAKGSSRVSSRKSISRISRSNMSASKMSEGNTSEESEEIKETETNNNVALLKGRKGRQTAKSKANAKVLQLEEVVEEVLEENDDSSVIPEIRKGRSKAAKNALNVSDNTTRMPGRSDGRKSVSERIIETESSMFAMKKTYTTDDNFNDDLDVYTPVARPTKSAARRKTLLPNLEKAVSGADVIPGNPTRTRSKRKTISGVSELTYVAPSKRLKSSSNQKSNATGQDDVAADDNLLETNDSYSEWIPLNSVDAKIPASPAIYELKVWRAKKTAYIGVCDSLREKLTLHKLRQNSGHKHLDKFIERNYSDIQIRYEVVSSINGAKVEVKNRINSFVAQHKTTPAYN